MGGQKDFFMGARPSTSPTLRLELAAGGRFELCEGGAQGVEARGVGEAVLVDEAAERRG
jgi:hypothetical protein